MLDSSVQFIATSHDQKPQKVTEEGKSDELLQFGQMDYGNFEGQDENRDETSCACFFSNGLFSAPHS